jgi:hypothetical protein
LAGARTVSVRSAFDDESGWQIFQGSALPPAANRDGSRAVHFKLTDNRKSFFLTTPRQKCFLPAHPQFRLKLNENIL